MLLHRARVNVSGEVLPYQREGGHRRLRGAVFFLPGGADAACARTRRQHDGDAHLVSEQVEERASVGGSPADRKIIVTAGNAKSAVSARPRQFRIASNYRSSSTLRSEISRSTNQSPMQSRGSAIRKREETQEHEIERSRDCENRQAG